MFDTEWLSVGKKSESGEMVELLSAPTHVWVLAILNVLTKEQRDDILVRVARTLDAARAAAAKPNPTEPRR